MARLFVVALIAALLTALSYASLGSRHPRAAGAAYVTGQAYGYPLLSFMVGLALVCSGLTSIATQSPSCHGTTDALGRFEVPLFVPLLGALVCLALIVVRVSTGDIEAPLLAGALLLGSLAIYAVMQKVR